jgi:hypothetical protein
MMHLYTCIVLGVISQHFNIGESAVYRVSRRIHLKIEPDKKSWKETRSVKAEDPALLFINSPNR